MGDQILSNFDAGLEFCFKNDQDVVRRGVNHYHTRQILSTKQVGWLFQKSWYGYASSTVILLDSLLMNLDMRDVLVSV